MLLMSQLLLWNTQCEFTVFNIYYILHPFSILQYVSISKHIVINMSAIWLGGKPRKKSIFLLNQLRLAANQNVNKESTNTWKGVCP